MTQARKERTYDPSAGFIETPQGMGRYVSFDHATGLVTVEVDSEFLARYAASECYVQGVQA